MMPRGVEVDTTGNPAFGMLFPLSGRPATALTLLYEQRIEELFQAYPNGHAWKSPLVAQGEKHQPQAPVYPQFVHLSQPLYFMTALTPHSGHGLPLPRW
jgi:hypothetical protein